MLPFNCCIPPLIFIPNHPIVSQTYNFFLNAKEQQNPPCVLQVSCKCAGPVENAHIRSTHRSVHRQLHTFKRG